MKYNAIENAERFITEQIAWCRENGYLNFSIWSNGKELQAAIDDNNIVGAMNRGELKTKGFWRAMQFVNGLRVEY